MNFLPARVKPVFSPAIWLVLVWGGLSSCNPAPQACFYCEEQTGMVFSSLHFTNCSRDADEFLWDFGDGGTSSDQNPIHAWADTGTFKVVLLARSAKSHEESVVSQSFKIGNPTVELLGSYSALLNGQPGFSLVVGSGNVPASCIFFLDGELFCNTNIRGKEFLVDAQFFQFEDWNKIRQGKGSFRNDSIFLSLELEKKDHSYGQLILQAGKISSF